MKLTYPRPEDAKGKKWEACALCGPEKYRGFFWFDGCSIAPTLGETITGATSGHTMVLESYTIVSGTVAGSNAAGVMEGTSPTGWTFETLEFMNNNESINGTNSGNAFATVNAPGSGHGGIHRSGRLYPLDELVLEEGKYYCQPHYRFRYGFLNADEERVDTSLEGDRWK